MDGYPSGQRGQAVNLLAIVFEGSNPSPSTMSGSSSVGRALAFQAKCREFEPRLPLYFPKSRCSSGVEHFLGKEEVRGSNPLNGSTSSFFLNSVNVLSDLSLAIEPIRKAI